MPNTIVVGDSVGLGISQALKGSSFAGGEGKRIDQMQADFNSAIAAAEKGDTVIISAGYNSTGPNGLAEADVKSLQTLATALNEKGAKVVLVPLRETGMTGDYARLNGQTAKTNAQLRTITGATVAEAALASANGIPNGEIHGAYLELGRASVEAAARISAPAAAPATAQTDGERQAAAADNGKKEQGWGEWIMGLINGLIEWITSFFSGGDKAQPETASPAATPTAPASEEAKASPDAKTQEAALAAARGNAAAGTGTSVSESSIPSLPDATGPRVKAVG